MTTVPAIRMWQREAKAGAVVFIGIGAAARLEADGMDVLIGGASAFSTLGYFADPVVSSMITGPEYQLVEMLVHELAHQKFYLRGDSDLNEAFATAVAEYGTLRWLTRSDDAHSMEAFREQVLSRIQFAELIGRQRERLRAIYAGPALATWDEWARCLLPGSGGPGRVGP